MCVAVLVRAAHRSHQTCLGFFVSGVLGHGDGSPSKREELMLSTLLLLQSAAGSPRIRRIQVLSRI